MNSYNLKDVLFYYDEILLAVVSYQNNLFLACSCDYNEEKNTQIFLTAKINENDLQKIENGKYDVREFYEDNSSIVFLIETADEEIFKKADIEVIPEYYPDGNYYLKTNDNEPEELQLSQDLDADILSIGFQQKSVRNSNSISIDTLSEGLSIINKVYSKIRQKSASNPRLEVIKTSAASFKAIIVDASEHDSAIKSTSFPNLMSILEAILSCSFNKKDLINLLSDQYSDLSGYIKDISEFILENGCPFYLKYASPELNSVMYINFNEKKAKAINAIYDENKNLSENTIEVSGTLEMADRKNKKWSLSQKKEKKVMSYSGTTESVDLSGLKIGNRYVFICNEKICEKVINKNKKKTKEKPKLILIKYQEL